MDRLRGRGDTHVAEYRAALLRHADLVEHGDALALEMRGHPEKCADRNDPGAANPGDENAEGLVERGQAGFGEGREALLAAIAGSALLEAAAFDGHETRAEPLEAGEILVAARLID